MLDRRTFLSGLTGALAAAPAQARPVSAPEPCWLDVAAPFVVSDPAQGLSTEILLTATCFPGVDGYRDSRYSTDYQVLLYDAAGKEIKLDNGGKFDVPAIRPTATEPA